MRRVFSIIIASLLIISFFGNIYAEDLSGNKLSDDLYDYEVTPTDSEWASLEVAERWCISNIPIEYAETHSSRALLLSLLKCPFISNIYYFNTSNEGIEIFCGDFPAMAVFLNRDDAIEQLNNYKNSFELKNDSSCNKESREYFEYIVVCDLIKYL